MSIPAMKWAMSLRGIRGAKKSVLIALAWHVHSKTGVCRPSLSVLAGETGWSKRTAMAAIDELEAAGLITVHVPKSRNIANRYVLNMDPTIEEIAPKRHRRRGEASSPRCGEAKPAPVVKQLHPIGNKGAKTSESILEMLRDSIRGDA